MRESPLLAALAVALLAGGGAAAAGEKPEGPPREKKICKSAAPTGSRIPAKKVCRTQAEWNEAASRQSLDEAEAALQRMNRRF